MTTRSLLCAAALTATLFAPGAAAAVAPSPHDGHDPVPDGPHAVDLALCLDTSGSMNGLIDSAKEKLWSIVNELATADPTPTLRVALLTYGNNGHDEEDGWVRLAVPLTTDLDVISEHLFALSTNGGTEYVGRVVASAMEQLHWSQRAEALKIVVVAGNETADQDPVRKYHEVCRSARDAGIEINAIYCDNGEQGVASTWEDVALLGSGYYAVIDQDHGTLAIDTPYDAELATLNQRLNETYIPFGSDGQRGWSNLVAQDSNAVSMNNASLADRVATKGGKLYRCAWDLVDACEAGDVDLEELAPEALPEPMQAMSLPERKQHVAAKTSERALLQSDIAALNKEREGYQARVRAERCLDDDTAFDRVLRDAVRSQARARGFAFPEPVSASAPIDGDGEPACTLPEATIEACADPATQAPCVLLPAPATAQTRLPSASTAQALLPSANAQTWLPSSSAAQILLPVSAPAKNLLPRVSFQTLPQADAPTDLLPEATPSTSEPVEAPDDC
jgi:Mg-chelatase subunit ChlD